MLKIDTSGKFAEVQASGDAMDLGKEIVMIAMSIAHAIAKDGTTGRIQAMVMLKTIGTLLSDDACIANCLDDALDDGIIAINPIEGETEEETRKRASIMAMQKFMEARPIKVDGDYNVIEDEIEDDNE